METWIKKFCVDDNEHEVVCYGIKILLQIIMGVLLSFFIGVVCGCFFQILMFIIFFVPLRINAGGLHMKSPSGCLLFSGMIFSLIALIVHSFSAVSLPLIALIIAAIVLYICSPVENKNKELFSYEKVRYKKRVLVIIILELLFYLIATCYKIDKLKQAIELAIIVETASVLLEHLLKMHIKGKYCNEKME